MALALLLAVIVDRAKGGIVVQYTFPAPATTSQTGTQYAATTLDPNVTADNVTVPATPPTIEISNATPLPTNAPFLRFVPGATSTTTSEAIAGARYFQFAVYPKAGFEFALTSLTFNVARGGTTTPRGYLIQSSQDLYTSTLATADVNTQRPTYTAVTVDLSGPKFQNWTGSLTFRFYAYAPADLLSVDFDDITLNGTVKSGPEPAGVAALGALALALKRRRD